MAIPASVGTRVLLVEADRALRSRLEKSLSCAGFQVIACPDGLTGQGQLKGDGCDLVISNRYLLGVDGLELLRFSKTHCPDVPVILIAERQSIPDAVEAVKLGAADYLPLPFPDDVVVLKVRELLELRRLKAENRALQDKLAASAFRSPANLVGRSEPMQRVYEMIQAVAPMDVTVLIYGESGTGKELVSRAIHACSSRKDGPFVKVSCSALVPTLLESELFGHEKGAFTGAICSRVGRFEQAKGGTIFLDDIDDVSLEIQTKLLRVLQDAEIERVGGGRLIPVDVRVVVASKCSLTELIQEKRFREDLFYRINVVPIHLPPLRDRAEDIPLLVHHFMEKFCKKFDRVQFACPDVIIDAFLAYAWPGNVRELENTIKRLTVLCHNKPVTLIDLPAEIQGAALNRVAKPVPVDKPDLNLRLFLARAESLHLREALGQCGWRIGECARKLGISRKSLWEKMRRHKLTSVVTDK